MKSSAVLCKTCKHEFSTHVAFTLYTVYMAIVISGLTCFVLLISLNIVEAILYDDEACIVVPILPMFEQFLHLVESLISLPVCP